MGSGVTIPARKGEYQPTRRLTLNVAEAAGGFLDWLSQNYILGIDAEDVAKFLLIEALEKYSTTDNVKRIKDFKRMIDEFTASRTR